MPLLPKISINKHMHSHNFQFSSSLKELTLLVVIYIWNNWEKKEKRKKEISEASKLSTSDWIDPGRLLCYILDELYNSGHP